MGQPYTGEIRIMAFGAAPRGWAQCNGDILQITSNPALFALIGTTYGGDGATTFALPDMRGRAPLSAGQVAGVSNPENYLLGQPGGESFHALTVAEIPDHAHSVNVRSGANTNSSTSPKGAIWATPADGSLQYATGAATATMAADIAPGPIGARGGGHENRQPYMALNFCIALQGS
jgi:microcystin-dependent protein